MQNDMRQPERAGQSQHHSTASPATHRFTYQGRSWRLWKRSTAPDARWYVTFYADRKATHRSLGSTAIKPAVEEAKSFIDAWLAGRRDARSGLAPKVPDAVPTSTLGELLRVLDSLDMVASRNARRTYGWGARRFFAFALDDPDPCAVRLDAVNGATAQSFWTRAIAHALKLSDQAAQNKFKRQAAGWFNNTKALFAADSVRSMAALGITPPAAADLAAFRASKPARFKVHKVGEFVAPDLGTQRATFRAWIALGAVQRRPDGPLNPIARRNMFLAVGLMLACGLRKNEVTQIRWRHLTRDAHGTPRLVARDVKVKKGTGELSVKPIEPFWRILTRTADRNGWRGAPDEYVLAERPKTAGDHGGLVFSHGGESDRTYWPFYHVGKWLRGLGWHMQKTNHALRDLAASYVTMKFGLDRAKLFCRHSSRATTESHYQKFVDEDLMDNKNKLAWLRWAR